VGEDFAAAFRTRLEDYYAQRAQNLFETSYQAVLRELLIEKGFPDVEVSVTRAALDALFAVTHRNWVLEEDAVLMLKILETAGYRMGIVSNAGDEQDVLDLVDQFGIRPYFDFVLTSATCSYRKPHTRIFEVALSHWGYPPAEAAMIGDTLDADIAGGRRAGLYTIWISRRAQRPARIPRDRRPDARIHTLLELPALLSDLQRSA
jgi:HAD superfamily hydrolase (TIGR01662 family)